MKAVSSAFSGMPKEHGVTGAQFLLRWGVRNGYAMLSESLNPERLKQSIDLEGLEIDNADMAAGRESNRMR